MAIIPAHLMRSVGGGYDNESVAVSCLCLTFLLWTYSLSGTKPKSMTAWGIFAGLAYICMAATWGGFIFVLNMIGLHAFVLFLLGRYTNKLYSAYTLWYVIGTIGAIQVPVIGYGPIKSLEQLAPGVSVDTALNSSFVLTMFGYHKKLRKVTWTQRLVVYLTIFGLAGAAAAAGIAYLWPRGYFGPLSSRIRGLFVEHTRTGNPLVDSVAEHQPANSEAFYQFLNVTCYTAPVGLAVAVLVGVFKPFFKPDTVTGRASQDPLVFLVVYALVTYGFSTKMNRLMLMMGPVAAVLTGLAFGVVLDFVVGEVNDLLDMFFGLFLSDAKKVKTTPVKEKVEDEQEVVESEAVNDASSSVKKRKKAKKDPFTPSTPTGKSDSKDAQKSSKSVEGDESQGVVGAIEGICMKIWTFFLVRLLRKAAAVGCVFLLYEHHHHAIDFYNTASEMSVGLSHPSIMFQATLRDGTQVMVDDYREAYWWLRDKTPADSRVLAWWDYGYQITGIGNRTSIADGNTWNHEHIALIGRCLTSPEKRAHAMIKHLADYVLIWAGGGGDDLAKSPHMARIGNSVFDDICPDDPTCQNFGFYQGGKPTPMMANSLLFKLHRNRVNPQVNVDPKRFKEVFMSEYGKVRIYEVVGVSKKSKQWAANATNKVCDAPGSWYCEGQYPPALAPVLKKRKSFAQLEDFNLKKDAAAKKYHEEYMKKMGSK
eukprot:CAMPEP_0114421070 /NCGR_PEP_ID=MMETSP0103-20121206/4886_1 /TAXON_ID=37642 ORGANISM="Paraphysomonas imperforata, Strain PA2" /NCGR_SAMPLE_ID=MMETSP0103 /ASSEMBLY_ACC=CAM_ASM_000201 /LENGTH=704 /DNA_ID=CAMNT_0001589575 /DNA_START=236 /DNA_END=2351 /DNA_ORIENTATION=+